MPPKRSATAAAASAAASAAAPTVAAPACKKSKTATPAAVSASAAAAPAVAAAPAGKKSKTATPAAVSAPAVAAAPAGKKSKTATPAAAAVSASASASAAAVAVAAPHSQLGVVDPAGLAQIAAAHPTATVSVHVDDATGELYDVELLQVDVAKNVDKFFILQLLVADSAAAAAGELYFVHTRWGRTGLDGQCQLDGPHADTTTALAAFAKKFADKTKNAWASRHAFVPKADSYAMIKVDHQLKAAARLQATKPMWQ